MDSLKKETKLMLSNVELMNLIVDRSFHSYKNHGKLQTLPVQSTHKEIKTNNRAVTLLS